MTVCKLLNESPPAKEAVLDLRWAKSLFEFIYDTYHEYILGYIFSSVVVFDFKNPTKCFEGK